MILKGLKNRLFGRFIHSNPHSEEHERKTKNFDEIKTMAFLLDGADPIALRELMNTLYNYQKAGKKLIFFGYVKKLPPFEDEAIYWITRKDMNWFGIPKSHKIKSFIEKEYDVLINTSMKTIRPLEYVSTYSKAGLRIGKFDEKKTYCYDFMMHMDNDATVYDYLNQVEHYLKMVKK